MKKMLIATILSLLTLTILIVVYSLRFQHGHQMPSAEPVPNSIFEVRPKDIRVIAALGDSITAGFVANGQSDPNKELDLKALVENRGVSFPIGGDEGAITLGNFFAEQNPTIIGRSIGSHLPNICTPTFCFGWYIPEKDQLNAARTGATATNINNQVTYLIDQMKSMSKINFQQDHKFISVLIGANDICRSCRTSSLLTADQFEENIKSLLEKIRLQIPRTIVNLYQLFNVSQLYDLTNNSPFCKERRSSILTSECRCAFEVGVDGDKKRLAMDELTVAYNQKLFKIASEYKEMNSTDFMVALDPAVTRFALKNVTLDYLSNTDCFHPSRKAHELFAKYAWNNLFLSYPEKKTITDFSVEVFRPTSDSVIKGM
jgi:lysophospholipase L1-like esterase